MKQCFVKICRAQTMTCYVKGILLSTLDSIQLCKINKILCYLLILQTIDNTPKKDRRFLIQKENMFEDVNLD